MSKIRLPSPALVIAVIALFVALGGTAFATVNAIVPKARLSLNSLKLQGKTAAQVAAIPGPASSGSALVSTVTASFSIAASGAAQAAPACPAGAKAIGGGFTSSGVLVLITSAPSADGSSWQMIFGNFLDSAATGTAYAVCMK
jgi:hypothetical protein